jgi:predicted NUDIX family NTP pyrophosphohydrolase
MTKESAGLLMFRIRDGRLQLLLAHPGGPFWKNKDAGTWTIPKGEIRPAEQPLAAARREFAEELGFAPEGNFIALTPIRQKGGKRVQVWAFEGDWDPGSLKSNTFQMEWPPRSGRMQEFPEIDRAEFFDFSDAKLQVNSAQVPCLEELEKKLTG